jgi:glycosyltransferase involved in cell wall biosynthesis
MSRRLRVAIASPGIGLVQRGFERLMRDLFEAMRGEFDVTLFKGGGPALPDEIVLRFLPRNGRLAKALPLHRLVGRTAMHTECLTFALAMLPHLRRGAFDVVHVIDPPLARVLYHLRARLGLRFKLLYTEGTAMPPGDYPPADHIHQIAATTLADAARIHARETMTLIPCGIYPERFVTTESRTALRHRHGISEDRFVIMAVSAINRGHKRTHHLIEEVAGLSGNPLLWLDGSLDHGDPELLGLARARLGDNVRITHVPSDRVGELYRLADVMPHAATFEAFGLAMVEAAASGLPVIAHDALHFQWLLPNPHCHVDMTQPGLLRNKLEMLGADRAMLDYLRMPSEIRQLYAWPKLVPAYVALYERLAA